MSAYKVTFTKEDGIEQKIVVEAMNRFRALRHAMHTAMIRNFKEVKIQSL